MTGPTARIARDTVRAGGPDAATFLQGQLSQEIEALAPGTSAWSFLLQPQGKVDAFLRVTRLDADAFLLDVDGGWGEAVVARLSRFKLRVRCDLELVAHHALAIRGEGDPPPVDGALAVVRFDWPGFIGWDALGDDAQLADAGSDEPQWDADVYEAERIVAGVPRMGSELGDKTIPAETGLVPGAVSFTKGCYTGQELVARIDSRGHVNRHLRRLHAASRVDVEPGAEILAGGAGVGSVTSVAWSARLGATVALGYVRREVEVPGEVTVRIADGEARFSLEGMPG